jgi:hypothetical protein
MSCVENIGTVREGQLPIVKQPQTEVNARRLLIKENCERDFRSPQGAPLKR